MFPSNRVHQIARLLPKRRGRSSPCCRSPAPTSYLPGAPMRAAPFQSPPSTDPAAGAPVLHASTSPVATSNIVLLQVRWYTSFLWCIFCCCRGSLILWSLSSSRWPNKLCNFVCFIVIYEFLMHVQQSIHLVLLYKYYDLFYNLLRLTLWNMKFRVIMVFEKLNI
jgi:hypothetical protein